MVIDGEPDLGGGARVDQPQAVAGKLASARGEDGDERRGTYVVFGSRSNWGNRRR